MFKFLYVLPVILLAGCWGGDGAVSEGTSPVEPVYTEGERPNFESNIDEEGAFDQARSEVQANEVPRFVEVVDEGDADLARARTEAEIAAAETDADREAKAIFAAQELARAQGQTGADNRGLEFREYSESLFKETKGLRAGLLYFTASDCTDCANWEEGLRQQAEAFSDLNTMIIMVDFNAETDFATSLNITEPGQALIMTPIGELLGPRTTEQLDVAAIQSIFQ